MTLVFMLVLPVVSMAAAAPCRAVRDCGDTGLGISSGQLGEGLWNVWGARLGGEGVAPWRGWILQLRAG